MIRRRKLHDRKRIFRVAGFALAAVGAFLELMSVGICVAILAQSIFRDMKSGLPADVFGFGIARMALLALHCRMFSPQWKLGNRMIERRSLHLVKTIGRMALRACLHKSSLVRIGMARLACGEFLFHIMDGLSVCKFALVALYAFNFLVLSGLLKFSLFVCEVGGGFPLVE